MDSAETISASVAAELTISAAGAAVAALLTISAGAGAVAIVLTISAVGMWKARASVASAGVEQTTTVPS